MRRLIFRIGLVLAALGIVKFGLRLVALGKQANPWATCLRPHAPNYPDLTGQLESAQAEIKWLKGHILTMEQGNAILRQEHAQYIDALKQTHRDEIKGMRGGR